MLRLFACSFVFGFLFHGLSAQSFLRTQGQVIVNEAQDTVLLRGMGLGGWMVQEGYMLQTDAFAGPQHEIRATVEALIGPADTEAFYTAWLDNHVRRADVDSLKAWGFNSVRLPMHYNLYTLPIEAEPVPGEQTWLDRGFALTDSLIAWCAANEMYVVLDLHAAPGGQGMDANISDYDDTKPSLWESAANREKMVALWGRLAARYADEPWVAGYDLLNEPNWELPGNVALRQLYEACTVAIRAVDDRHIIFIEGNWFANDFTGLTPPWDDELVYSPHKYWSANDPGALQFALDLRAAHDVPLYLGESGENSNVWFRDAIRLLEDLDIGWAWWPMKKIDNIAGPLSIPKTPEYQTLLDYWSGNGAAPTAAFGSAALLQLAQEGLRIENCRYQKDVIDAMFRQVYSDATVPFRPLSIPGVIYAADYDMGVLGAAYRDTEVANYRVSTGNFTAWNNGWTYRNDGVDIEPCTDDVNTNGVNVGWLDAEEWMQYTAEIAEAGVYELRLRTASGAAGGSFYLGARGADLTPETTAPATGGWQNWETVVVPDVLLDPADKQLRFYVGEAGFNLSSLEFVLTDTDPATLPAEFLSAVTVNEQRVQLNLNKPLADADSALPGDFQLMVDGTAVPIVAVAPDPDHARVLLFDVAYTLRADETIQLSYTGTALTATDGTSLDAFNLEPVRNELFFVHPIPGRIQAEDFADQVGISLETSTDAGGGQNLAYLDPGDYADYEVRVETAGSYQIDFRTAAEYGTGGVALRLIDRDGNEQAIGAATFANTGGWQSWATTSTETTGTLAPGRYTLRLEITQAPFNLNWLDFAISTNTAAAPTSTGWQLSPNPVSDLVRLSLHEALTGPARLEVYDATGRLVRARTVRDSGTTVSLRKQAAGAYLFVLRLADGRVLRERVVKK